VAKRPFDNGSLLPSKEPGAFGGPSPSWRRRPGAGRRRQLRLRPPPCGCWSWVRGKSWR